jgi:hypothetical protein
VGVKRGRRTLLKGPKQRCEERPAAHDARAACERPVRFSLPLVGAFALAVATTLAGNPETGSLAQHAEAQQAQRVDVTVPAITRAEPASRTRLQIQVGPQEAIAKNSFIRIRGLPAAVALSEGHSIAPGAWAVPLVALPNLAIILPVGQQGPAEVAISLVSIEGAILAEAKTTLVVTAAASTSDDRKSPSTGATPPVPIPKLTPADRERALGLHAKGLEQLERGNVYAARKFFERAAELGLAQSAVAVAGTHDPDELVKLGVVGLQPDVQAARRWYERARELGAVEATERLRRLGSR